MKKQTSINPTLEQWQAIQEAMKKESRSLANLLLVAVLEYIKK